MTNSKTERLIVVNTIIKEIASRGRDFFKNNENGQIAYFIFKGDKRKRLYFVQQDGTVINPYSNNSYYHFMNGGILFSLMREFNDFILTGEATNGKHGYAGLYGSHWGYLEEDLKAIQELAKELGYLK